MLPCLLIVFAGLFVPVPQRLKPIQPTYRVILEADMTNPPLGKSVRFKGVVTPTVEAIKCRFNFGDGTQSDWLSVPETSHLYRNPGPYVAMLIARIGEREYQSPGVAIDVREITLRLRLIGSPVISAGQPVGFEVRSEPDYPELQYQFRFGDGEASGWTNEFRSEHRYEKEGSYRVRAVARVGEKILIESNFVIVEIAPSPMTYAVSLEANPQEIRQEEAVRFRARLNPEISRAEYRFQFGDGTNSHWTTEPEIGHVYSTPGVFHAFVIARRAEEFLAESNSATIEVRPSDIREIFFAVTIQARPRRAKPGDPVLFRAEHKPPIEDIEYQFVYGDEEIRDWSDESAAVHAYSREGTYSAYVRARRDPKHVSESSRILVRIEKRRPLILWGGIGATVVLVFGAGPVLLSRAIRSRKTKRLFRATFKARPKKDKGVQQTEPGSPVRSDYEARLKPVLDRGKQEIEAEGSLILQERREHE